MTSPIDFSKLRGEMINYLSSIKTIDAFPYPLQKGSTGSFYGSCFAALISELLNYDLPDADKIRDELYARLDPATGLVSNEELDSELFHEGRQHDEQYLSLQTTYFARSALYALKESNLPPVQFALDLAEKGQVFEWLDSLNWENPWLVSNMDMFLGIFLIEWTQKENYPKEIDTGIQEYFRWHEEKQSSKDGFWGGNPDLLERMAGGYHIYVIYDALNRDIPYFNQAVNATRTLQWADGLYVYGGGGGACEDMDAIDILVRGIVANVPKTKELERELKLVADRIALNVNNDGGFGWRIRLSAAWFVFLTKNANWKGLFGALKGLAFKIKNRSHYKSIHLYSSCEIYPFKLDVSDTWSTWFRASSLAMIAQSSPEQFENECDWYLHKRAGLGLDPRVNVNKPE